ncbi:hypothetical protein DVR12_07330 [Chitinophaga silvatica]|uniref:DUF3990 domain-containing protein n=2 Tax=Chitinophaga silvatica TaxID=2282649 RepID=A0A3E1YET3_9BACT|nr:hypothetical protein DVR12_07330 [Chitinophaga silvatica]
MHNSEINYSSDHGLLLGFHGCDKAVRDAVLLGETELRGSNNNFDWLGDGIYFWQNNYSRALDYATNPPPNIIIKHPAVLGAVFSLGNCLDLTDRECLRHINSSYRNLIKISEDLGAKVPKNIGASSSKDIDRLLRYLDCSVIKNLHRIVREGIVVDELLVTEPFESVRAAFIEGEPIYEGAGFYNKTHIQICIRNPNLIKGYFMPRRELEWIP